MILAITALIIGALLGLRFKVSILFAAIAVGSAAPLAIGMAHGLGSILLAKVVALSALQMGYLGGVVHPVRQHGCAVRKDSHKIVAAVQRPAR
jgi:hypothetical protein